MSASCGKLSKKLFDGRSGVAYVIKAGKEPDEMRMGCSWATSVGLLIFSLNRTILDPCFRPSRKSNLGLILWSLFKDTFGSRKQESIFVPIALSMVKKLLRFSSLRAARFGIVSDAEKAGTFFNLSWK